MINNVVYNVEVQSKGQNRTYIVSTGGFLRIDTPGIIKLLIILIKSKILVLSYYVWKYFQRYGKRPKMVWSFIHNIKHNTSCAQKICQTCNMERAAVAAEDKEILLNKRLDLFNVRLHNKRFFFK